MAERIVYLNGNFLPESHASLPIFDRGLLFADSVYEGFGILDGQIVDFIYHMGRLEQSLAKLNIPIIFTTDSMFNDLMRLIAENNAENGFLYLGSTYLEPSALNKAFRIKRFDKIPSLKGNKYTRKAWL